MNLTDNDIIKALECCTLKESCIGCPFVDSIPNKYRGGYACAETMRKSALDLINRQKAVNKLQAKEIVDLKIKIKEQRAEIEKCEKIDHFAQKTIDLQTAEIKKLEAEVEGLHIEGLQINKTFMDFVNKQITEAIKEFAERLKKEIDIRPTYSREQNKYVCFLIDNLVKEMVGEPCKSKVIHCGKCEFRNTDGFCFKNINGVGYKKVSADDYCSYGKTKESE